MRSSHMMTLFSERTDLNRRPSSFAVSILVHAAGLGLLSLGILYAPENNNRVLAERYTVRHLDLHTIEPRMQRTDGSRVEYPGPHPVAYMNTPGGKPTEQPAVLRQIAKATPGPQTLVQPYLHSHLSLNQETPVPAIVIWTTENASAKTIAAPLPEKPPAAGVQPSLDPPNEEVNLADLGISATELAAQAQAVPPSTTAPVVVRGPELLQMAPATTVASSAQPIPGAVMSLSDLRMTDGSVTLPPVNETFSSTLPGAQGQAEDSSQAGSGNPAGKAGGMGAGPGSGDGDGQPEPSENTASQTKTQPVQSVDAASGSGNQPLADHITLPRDGQFEAVVVGASLEEQYPETAGLLSGRMAYTVYLHVGLARSWILQYSLPRDADAAAAGNVARLEAPWPYNIVRPNLASGAINADALMVHGFVNRTGRFERLAIAFPPEFAQAQFVLGALEQWQFRPAKQNGQMTRVEVLLIIPEETE
jgi:hypothetical protein